MPFTYDTNTRVPARLTGNTYISQRTSDKEKVQTSQDVTTSTSPDMSRNNVKRKLGKNNQVRTTTQILKINAIIEK